MSLSSVTTLAIKRDETPLHDELRVGSEKATWGKVLVKAIPTEILTVYTASLGVASGLATSEDPQAYLPFRFVWYGVWLVATPAIAGLLYYRKTEELRKEKLKASPGGTLKPIRWWKGVLRPETAAATVAAAAWFTAMPGSPWQVSLSGGAFALTSMVATAVGALVGANSRLFARPPSGA